MTSARTARIGAAVVLTAAALAAAGCSSGSGTPGAATTPSATVVPTPTCPSSVPSPSASADKVMRYLPVDLPVPPNVTPIDTTTTTDNVRIVRFSTPTNLRDGVLFILQRYQKAGYVIGRGDAEATEADAPWVRGTTRGLTRLAQVQLCQTLWLVAVVSTKGSGANSPLLSPHPTSRTTSALPFG